MEDPITYCWNKIGITGDKSCPQLQEVIHCRNCSVYSSLGRVLFEREAPSGYLEEWTELLGQPLTEESIISNQSASFNPKTNESTKSATSLIIFRLLEEWFALPVHLIKEVTPVFTVHTLPHRSNNILRGIVNIRGEILLCVSLANLLNLKPSQLKKQNSLSTPSKKSKTYPRMIVIEIQENRWVFEVDELDRITRFTGHHFQDSPSAISKTTETYTKKILSYNDKKINYLDSELLFYELLFYTWSREERL